MAMDKNLNIALVCFSVFFLALIPSEISAATIPSSPTDVTATAISPTQINIFWNPLSNDGASPITGYKIEVKSGSGSYSVLGNTVDTTYSHTGLTTGTAYTYKVSAINSVGTSTASSEVSATPSITLKLNKLENMLIDEGQLLSFVVKVTDSSLNDLVYSLDKNPPTGAKINSSTGLFSWTPSFTVIVIDCLSVFEPNFTTISNVYDFVPCKLDVLNTPEPTNT
jgi:hypothetical protein